MNMNSAGHSRNIMPLKQKYSRNLRPAEEIWYNDSLGYSML